MIDTLIRPRLRPPIVDEDTVPPLANGDNLKSDEFMRRYEAMPHKCKAELIGGIVFMDMASPLSHKQHGRPHVLLSGVLFTYVARTPGTDPGDNSTTRLNDDETPQPDLLLRIEHGGNSVEDGDYLAGGPELVCEIANTSASLDLNQKFATYLHHGVEEYLVWRMHDRRIDWFAFDGGDYLAIEPDANGVLKSRVFPGLWLDTNALLDRDLLKLAATVEAGCATQEHAAFVERLAAASQS